MLIWFRVGALAASFAFGFYCHVVYAGYSQKKEQIKTIEKLGEGQNEIIKFNQDFDKGLVASKDDCVSKPIPDSLRLLLQ
jgi:hypothetical protein